MGQINSDASKKDFNTVMDQYKDMQQHAFANHGVTSEELKSLREKVVDFIESHVKDKSQRDSLLSTTNKNFDIMATAVSKEEAHQGTSNESWDHSRQAVDEMMQSLAPEGASAAYTPTPHQAQSGSSGSTSYADAVGGTSVGAVANGPRQDLSKWTQETYAAGTFNNEQQRYTNGNQNVSFDSKGAATITARKENGQWTSARLTGDKVGKLPAYLEANITVPTGQGTWPAFWLTSQGSWPQGGEIDVMEQINGDGDTHMSNHWGANTGEATFNTKDTISGLDLTQPHRYGTLITDKGVQFYLDGKQVGKPITYPPESNFAQIASQMVPVVNLAMGGNWPGNVPSSTGDQQMVVNSIIKTNEPPK